MALPTTQEELTTAYLEAPEEIKEILSSEETFGALEEIASAHGLDDFGLSIIGAFTGAVLLGFLPPDELADELERVLEKNRATVENIAGEISQEVFLPLKKVLSKVYSEETIIEETEEKPSENDTGEKPADLSEVNVGALKDDSSPLPTPKPPEDSVPEDINEKSPPEKGDTGTPFIIHEETGEKISPETKGKQTKKGFSFSLGKVFGEQKSTEKKSPRAKIEAPGKPGFSPEEPGKGEHKTMSEDKEPKVVHYSEYRTQPEINIEKKSSPPSPSAPPVPEATEIKPPAPPTPKPRSVEEIEPFDPVKSSAIKEPKKTNEEKPKMEGNTINLKGEA